MRLEFFPYPLFTGLAALGLLLPILWRRQRSVPYLFYFAVFWLYLLLVVSVTLFPIPLPENRDWRQPVLHILQRVNLNPLHFGDLFEMPLNYAIHELGGNILLTVPFGFGLPFLVRFKARSVPWLALAAGLATEGSQLILSLIVGGSYRSVDTNDVLLNTIGVLIGYGIFRGIAMSYFTRPSAHVKILTTIQRASS